MTKKYEKTTKKMKAEQKVVNEKNFKQEKPIKSRRESEMGLFGKGRGFLGVSSEYNKLITIISTILGVLGIVYFVSINQPFSAMGVLAVWILVQIETYR